MNQISRPHVFAEAAHYTPDVAGAISAINALYTAEQAVSRMVAHPAQKFSDAADALATELSSGIERLRDALYAECCSAESDAILANGSEKRRLLQFVEDCSDILDKTMPEHVAQVRS